MRIGTVFVLGCGRWGSFVAWYLDRLGANVHLYGREGSGSFETLRKTRTNGVVSLGKSIIMTSDLSEMHGAEAVFIAVPSQSLRISLNEAKPFLNGKTPIVLCMKGIENGTDFRLTEVTQEIIGADYPCAVWLGPGHPQDFVRGIPNCMVIDSGNEELKRSLSDMLSSELLRFYYGTDLIGNELGAAAKNVIGIAAGMLDGLGMSPLKGSLMSRAPREIASLIVSLGGDEISAYGLCHLGDYEATLFSLHSNNRRYGQTSVTGEAFSKLAEGYYSVSSICSLAEKRNVDMPICRAVYEVLYNGRAAGDALNSLFERPQKKEFLIL